MENISHTFVQVSIGFRGILITILVDQPPGGLTRLNILTRLTA